MLRSAARPGGTAGAGAVKPAPSFCGTTILRACRDYPFAAATETIGVIVAKGQNALCSAGSETCLPWNHVPAVASVTPTAGMDNLCLNDRGGEMAGQLGTS
jgi:hypothetical protein